MTHSQTGTERRTGVPADRLRSWRWLWWYVGLACAFSWAWWLVVVVTLGLSALGFAAGWWRGQPVALRDLGLYSGAPAFDGGGLVLLLAYVLLVNGFGEELHPGHGRRRAPASSVGTAIASGSLAFVNPCGAVDSATAHSSY